MSFWSTSTGENALETEHKAEFSSGFSNEPLPNNTNAKSMIEKVEWQSPQDSSAKYINFKFRILEPSDYNNKVIFYKLWVKDDNPSWDDNTEKNRKKKDKALIHLARINNCYANGRLNGLTDWPTDEQLMAAFAGKVPLIQWGAYSFNDREGNYIIEVIRPDDKEKYIVKDGDKKEAKPSYSGNTGKDIGDSIPF